MGLSRSHFQLHGRRESELADLLLDLAAAGRFRRSRVADLDVHASEVYGGRFGGLTTSSPAAELPIAQIKRLRAVAAEVADLLDAAQAEGLDQGDDFLGRLATGKASIEDLSERAARAVSRRRG